MMKSTPNLEKQFIFMFFSEQGLLSYRVATRRKHVAVILTGVTANHNMSHASRLFLNKDT